MGIREQVECPVTHVAKMFSSWPKLNPTVMKFWILKYGQYQNGPQVFGYYFNLSTLPSHVSLGFGEGECL